MGKPKRKQKAERTRNLHHALFLLTKNIQLDCVTINAPVNSGILRCTTQVCTVILGGSDKVQGTLERGGAGAEALAVLGKG